MGRAKKPYKIRHRPDSPYWYCQFEGQKNYQTTPVCVKMRSGKPWNRAEVERWAIQQCTMREIVQGKPVTVAEYTAIMYVPGTCPILAAAEKRTPIKTTTIKQRRQLLDQYIVPKWGAFPLAEIRGRAVEDWLVNLKAGNSLRNQILITFRIVLRQAVLDDHIAANPLESLAGFSQRPDRQQQPVSLEHLQKLFPEDPEEWSAIWKYPRDSWMQKDEEPTPWHGTMFYVLLTTGLRSGEIRALKWKSVRWNDHALVVAAQIDKTGDYTAPKAAEYRAVPLTVRCEKLLADWQQKSRFNADQDYVFTNTGRPIQARRLQEYLNKAMERAQISARITPHTFRHTYSTIMRTMIAEQGHPDEWIRSLTGHRSEAMSEHYDHPTDEQLVRRLHRLSGLDVHQVDSLSSPPRGQ